MSERKLQELSNLIRLGQNLVAVESPLTEREKVLAFVSQVAYVCQLPLFFWNRGYKQIQKVVVESDNLVRLLPTEWEIQDGLSWLNTHAESGLFVFEGVLSPDSSGDIDVFRLSLLSNLAFKLAKSLTHQVLLCLEAYVELPLALTPFIPILSNPFPSASRVRYLCDCASQAWEVPTDDNFPKQLQRLIRACIALPLGELEMALRSLSGQVTSVPELADAVIEYKKSKFKGRGVEFIASADVAEAAGLELLEAALERSAALLRPEAAVHNLTFTRGILLWGPPGTGKSLSAKLAAQKIGVPLVAADWAGLRGSTAYESRKNLKEFLLTIDALGEGGLILYFDDFDKGFSGFDANNDGGIARQLTGKLLTWMQEHTSKVCVIATVNRLGFLPPELIRRFEENIYFVDLPHEGARYEIFNLHLKKYFPNFQFTEQEWQKLLSETHLLTSAEIGNLVKRAASEIFYQNAQQLDAETLASQPLKVTLEDLMVQRYSFTPSMIRDEDAIVAIRNQASFARPAAAPDQSKWAKKKTSLFDSYNH